MPNVHFFKLLLHILSEKGAKLTKKKQSYLIPVSKSVLVLQDLHELPQGILNFLKFF